MLVESAIANLSELPTAPPDDFIDWLDLTWAQCRQRFARRTTRGGVEVRLLLAVGQTLKHGDVLGSTPGGKTIIVNLLEADGFIIRLQNAGNAVTVAFQMGNLHLPIEIFADQMFVPCTSEVEAMLVKFEIAFQPGRRLFQPTHWPNGVQLSPDFQIIRRGD